MILIDTTIAFSVSIKPFLYFLFVITIMLCIAAISNILYDKFNNILKYNNTADLSLLSYQKRFYILLVGVLLVPLFKNQIKDAIKLKYYNHKMEDNIMQRKYSLNNSLIDDYKLYKRKIALLKLKYKQKNFVKRNIFHIFVSK